MKNLILILIFQIALMNAQSQTLAKFEVFMTITTDVNNSTSGQETPVAEGTSFVELYERADEIFIDVSKGGSTLEYEITEVLESGENEYGNRTHYAALLNGQTRQISIYYFTQYDEYTVTIIDPIYGNPENTFTRWCRAVN